MSVVPQQHYPEPYHPEELWDPEIRDLLATQVDDLAKYHVVTLLHQHPEAAGDAAFYAASLGFHSVDDTRTVLEELVQCGLLRRELNRDTGNVAYYTSNDVDCWRKVTKLCSLNPQSESYRQVLRLLANRSLHRAELRKKYRRNGLECA